MCDITIFDSQNMRNAGIIIWTSCKKKGGKKTSLTPWELEILLTGGKNYGCISHG